MRRPTLIAVLLIGLPIFFTPRLTVLATLVAVLTVLLAVPLIALRAGLVALETLLTALETLLLALPTALDTLALPVALLVALRRITLFAFRGVFGLDLLLVFALGIILFISYPVHQSPSIDPTVW